MKNFIFTLVLLISGFAFGSSHDTDVGDQMDDVKIEVVKHDVSIESSSDMKIVPINQTVKTERSLTGTSKKVATLEKNRTFKSIETVELYKRKIKYLPDIRRKV